MIDLLIEGLDQSPNLHQREREGENSDSDIEIESVCSSSDGYRSENDDSVIHCKVDSEDDDEDDGKDDGEKENSDDENSESLERPNSPIECYMLETDARSPAAQNDGKCMQDSSFTFNLVAPLVSHSLLKTGDNEFLLDQFSSEWKSNLVTFFEPFINYIIKIQKYTYYNRQCEVGCFYLILMTIKTEKEAKERRKCNVRLSIKMAQSSIKPGSVQSFFRWQKV